MRKKTLLSTLAALSMPAMLLTGCGEKVEPQVEETAKPSAAPVEEEVVDVFDTECKGDERITILATSDVHGRIYPYDYAVDEENQKVGYSKVATFVKNERAKDPELLLVDCGDTAQDNSAELFNDMEIHPTVQCLNDLDYDTWTVGNHEFNFSLPFLERNVEGFKGTTLATNIYKEGSDERYLDPYKIFDVKGARVAVIGLLAPHVPVWEASTPAHFEGLEFRNSLEETKKAIKELEGQYDVLVGAYHLGPDGEYGGEGIMEIVEACPEFDLMIGGHSHTDFNEVVEVNGKTIPVIEPYRWGQVVSKANIDLKKTDDGFEVVDIVCANVPTKDLEADADMLEKYKFVHDESIDDANTIVGEVTDDFIERVDYITGDEKVTTMPTAQIEDTALIDFINEVQQFYTDADISTAAAFKKDMNLKKGDFRKKDVANIYKFPNTLYGVNLTGKNLKEYMEFCADYYNQYNDGDVTISFNPEVRSYMYDMYSGIDYKIDISKPVGERIVDATINGEPLDPNKTYKVAVNNYRLGTLITHDWATLDDVYYDSYEEYQDAGRIRDLIIKYVNEECDGKITPHCDHNWEIIGNPDFNNERKEEVYDLIRSGEVKIPSSEDERTPNVKSVNINELIEEGILK